VTARGFGLVSLLVALALVGALWAMNARSNGPASSNAKRIETQAQQVSAAANFIGAATQLETFRADSGTYVGASLPPSFGVQLVRADATSYCLQAGAGTAVQHYIGPGGTPAAGPC
jgi:Tfp pilus assembly protein PilE